MTAALRETVAIGKFMVADQELLGYWVVTNKRHGDILGFVEWSRAWKMWVFSPAQQTEFSPDCLEALVKFMKGLPPK